MFTQGLAPSGVKPDNNVTLGSAAKSFRFQTKSETLYQGPVTFWNDSPTLHLPATILTIRVCCAPACNLVAGVLLSRETFRCGETRSRIRRSHKLRSRSRSPSFKSL
jgi:hypothetical protein